MERSILSPEHQSQCVALVLQEDLNHALPPGYIAPARPGSRAVPGGALPVTEEEKRRDFGSEDEGESHYRDRDLRAPESSMAWFSERAVEEDEKKEERGEARSRKPQSKALAAKPQMGKRVILPFALLIVFLSGAVLASVGLSGFVDSLLIYKAFMLFVAANGVGGLALAGIVLGAGLLMMLGVLAYLFWPSQKPPAPAPLPNAAETVAELVHRRQENRAAYSRLAAAAEQAQAPGRAQRGENVQALRHSFLTGITRWLFTVLWAFGLYQQQQQQQQERALLEPWARQYRAGRRGSEEEARAVLLTVPQDLGEPDGAYPFSSPLSSSYGSNRGGRRSDGEPDHYWAGRVPRRAMATATP